MLSLTANFCCRRLPPRISTLITVTFGRVNLGAQPLKTSAAGKANHPTVQNSLGPPWQHARNDTDFRDAGFGDDGSVGGRRIERCPARRARAARAGEECTRRLSRNRGWLLAREVGGSGECAHRLAQFRGTRCEGESRDKPPGVRLSFQRAAGGSPNLLLVFGLTGVQEGQPAHEVKTNLTLIVQGTSHIYGTLGDSRCTVDSLTQRPLEHPRLLPSRRARFLHTACPRDSRQGRRVGQHLRIRGTRNLRRTQRMRISSPMRDFLLGLLLTCTALSSHAAPEPLSAFPKTQLAVRTASGQVVNFLVWIADSPSRSEQGLMFVRDLDPHAGMLFEFSGSERVTMWMKNTYVSLDMLFIGAHGRIDYIAPRTTPQSLDIISAPNPVSEVLELKGGTAEQFGIHVGDVVVHGKPVLPK